MKRATAVSASLLAFALGALLGTFLPRALAAGEEKPLVMNPAAAAVTISTTAWTPPGNFRHVDVTNNSATPIYWNGSGVSTTNGHPICNAIATCPDGAVFHGDVGPGSTWFIAAGPVAGVLYSTAR